jgi:hypothetical protein
MKSANAWKTTQLLGLIASKKLTPMIRLTRASLIYGGTILTSISSISYLSNMLAKSPSINLGCTNHNQFHFLSSYQLANLSNEF